MAKLKETEIATAYPNNKISSYDFMNLSKTQWDGSADIEAMVESTGYGVITGYQVTQYTTPNMSVQVTPGTAHMPNGQRYAQSTTLVIPIAAADPTNPRIDLIYLDAVNGGVSRLTGTAAASPITPALPTGCVGLATVAVAANATTIVTANITDIRSFKPNYQNAGKISVKDFGAKGNANFFHNGYWYADAAYTTLASDDSDAINNTLAALNLNVFANPPDVDIPAGRYYHTKPLNLTGRNIANNAYGSRRIWGAGSNSTVFYSNTGVYPAIDMTGSTRIDLRGFRIIADNNQVTGQILSKVGIVNRRGVTNGYCHFNTYNDIIINLGSDVSANGGIGTIPFLNFGGEHIGGSSLEFYGNLSMVNENVLDLGINNSAYSSAYETPAATSPSCTCNSFGTVALITYDAFRAVHLNQVGGFIIDNLYVSTRKITGTMNGTTETIYLNGATGTFINCYEESSGLFGSTYRTDHSFVNVINSFQGNKIRIERAAFDMGYTLPGSPSATILLQNQCDINNSDIDCHYAIGAYNASGDTIGQSSPPIKMASGNPKWIRNTKFTLDQPGHSVDIFSAVASYVTNCKSINWLTGQTLEMIDQVKYPSTQVPSADPNTQDDYEEGTWTPTGTNVAPVTCKYTKIGNTVFLWAAIYAQGGAASTVIGGLPFVSAPLDANNNHGGSTMSQSMTGGTQFGVVIATSSNTFQLMSAATPVALINTGVAKFQASYTIN